MPGPGRNELCPCGSGRKVKRSFCPACGSGIVNEPEVWPEYVVIRIGSLDDPNVVTAPTHEFYAKARAPWIAIGKGEDRP